MTSGRDCDDFLDGLDAYLAGTTPPAAARRLETHATACADCAALLAVERRLAATTAAELEAAVPEPLAAGMWERVAPLLGPRADAARVDPSRRRAPWYARPALAWAATLVLVLGNGLLAAELLRVRRQVGEVAATAAQVRDAATMAPWLAAGAAPDWGGLTVAEAAARLDRLPRAALLAGPEATERWLAGLSRAERLAARAWLREVDLTDGLQAGEARALLDAVPAAGDTPLRQLLPASLARAAQRA